jgi:hypothetical protein
VAPGAHFARSASQDLRPAQRAPGPSCGVWAHVLRPAKAKSYPGPYPNPPWSVDFLVLSTASVASMSSTASATTASSPAVLATSALARARQLLEVAASTATDPQDEPAADDGPQSALANPCPCCGGRMIVIETFEAGCQPRHPTIRIDTS